jgi:colicin import membrane protein
MDKPPTSVAFLAGASLATFLTLAGCNKPSQEDAEKAQREATEKAERARVEAAEKISEARRDAEKAANDAAKARGDARGELQKDVDAVDRKISYIKERAVEVKGTAKKNADVAQAEAEKRRTTLRDDFRKLETETGAAWDSAKADVERDIKSLKDSVDSWESTVTNKPAH